MVALDAKMNFDDNALYRHPDIVELRDVDEEDPREAKAKEHDLAYIALDGNIGCMVNGAGLAMATMDTIKLVGGQPANFLDVGGGATKEKVTAAFKLILADPAVKAVLVNIFGGIMKCDVIAEGVIAAAKEVHLKVPLVVRLEGTNVEQGKALLKASGLQLIPADNLRQAAEKAVSGDLVRRALLPLVLASCSGPPQTKEEAAVVYHASFSAEPGVMTEVLFPFSDDALASAIEGALKVSDGGTLSVLSDQQGTALKLVGAGRDRRHLRRLEAEGAGERHRRARGRPSPRGSVDAGYYFRVNKGGSASCDVGFEYTVSRDCGGGCGGKKSWKYAGAGGAGAAGGFVAVHRGEDTDEHPGQRRHPRRWCRASPARPARSTPSRCWSTAPRWWPAWCRARAGRSSRARCRSSTRWSRR